MITLKENAGPGIKLAAIRRLHSRLVSRADTSALAGPVAAARDRLKAAWEEHQAAEDASIVATGAVKFADVLENVAIADIARDAKSLVKGNLSDPRYLKLFTTAPSTVVAGVADEGQATLSAHLIATLKGDPTYAPLLPLLPALEAARTGVEAAVEGRKRCRAVELGTWNKLQLAEAEVVDVYNGAEPRLEILFPGKKTLVDSFFPSPPPKKKA